MSPAYPRRDAVIAGLLSAALVVVAARAGLTEALGAHPFWSVKVALYGLVPGLLLVVVFAGRPRRGLALAVALLAIAVLAAWLGKRGFAASYAENAWAGRAWFWGWIVACGAAVAALGLAGLRGFPRAGR